MLSQLWDGTCFEWGEEPDGALSEAKSDGEDSPNAEGVAENLWPRGRKKGLSKSGIFDFLLRIKTITNQSG